MSNPTPPDCVHCRFMVRQRDGEYRCQQHNMTLHTPVQIFCHRIAPPLDDDDYNQWFQQTMSTDTLKGNALYTWVETLTRDDDGEIERHIDREIIAPLTTYVTWSAGTFWDVLRDVRQARRDHYRQHGYDIDG